MSIEQCNSLRDSEVKSPCVSICSLNEREICIGCFRSLSEIATWSEADASKRKAIIKLSLQRRDEFFDKE